VTVSDIIAGPEWDARNWSIDAGEGSIHDDATATTLGFRGGTVAGDVHMNQFVPVLLEVFGFRWFEQGNLSLDFKNATVDGETVQVFAEPLQDGQLQTKVWMERLDGMLVCSGTAAMGDHSASALRERDLRPCDPNELRILSQVKPGMSLGSYDVHVDPERQFQLFDSLLISDPLDFYRTGSHWGDVVACPSTIVQQLWGVPMAGLRPVLGDVVGLFGAIEVGHTRGPMILNRDYHFESAVISVGQSPKTEYLWFETTAYQPGGDAVADMRMMLRFMKSSSPYYQD
jgi:hypothetical protein